MKISKFITSLLSQGGIAAGDGLLFVYKNPFVFLPINVFVKIQKAIEDVLGDKAEHFIFWLGYVQGKSSSELFIKRFGYRFKSVINPKNFEIFMDGTNLVGMGEYNITKYDPAKGGQIICKNPYFSEKYKSTYGKTNSAKDYYMRGIMAGGATPLLNDVPKFTETQCVAKGDSHCQYDIEFVKEKYDFNFKYLPINTNQLNVKSEQLFVKRQSFIRNVFRKSVRFVNGKFIYQDMQGVVLPAYLFAIVMYVLKNVGKVKYPDILEPPAEEYLKLLYGDKFELLNNKKSSVDELLKKLNVLGMGLFSAKYMTKKLVYVSNTQNPYAKDYLTLFGKQKQGVDEFICKLLKIIFGKIHGNKVDIKETQCIATGNNLCKFEVKIYL